MNAKRTHPPLPPDMLKAFAGRLHDVEKPAWVLREMTMPEGSNKMLIPCTCRLDLLQPKDGEISTVLPSYEEAVVAAVTIRACKWSATLPGKPPVVAKMLYGQCDGCDTIYWDVANDWTGYLLLRFTAQNEALGVSPIIVPGISAMKIR